MVSLWVHICIINKWRDKAVTEPFLRSEILWYVQNFQWFQNFIFPVEIILTNSHEFLKFDEYCRSCVTCRVHFVPKAVWLLILFKECLSIFKKLVAPSDSWSAVRYFEIFGRHNGHGHENCDDVKEWCFKHHSKDN